MGHRLWVLFCLLISCCVPALALPGNTVVVENQEQVIDLTPALSFQLGQSNLDINDILNDLKLQHHWQPLSEFKTGTNIAEQQTLWLNLRIKNQTKNQQQRVLFIPFPLLDHVEVFVTELPHARLKERFVMGLDVEFQYRPYPMPGFAIPLPMSSEQELAVYLKIQDRGAAMLAMSLWPEQQLIGYAQNQSAWHGAVIAALLLMFIIQLLRFSQHPDSRQLLFALVQLSTVFCYTAIEGVGFQWMWPTTPEFNQSMLYISSGFLLFSLSAYSRALLPNSSLWVLRGLTNFALVISCVLWFSPVWAESGALYRTLMLCSLATLSLLLAVALIQWLRSQRDPDARPFRALSVLLIAALLLVFGRFGILPYHLNNETSFILVLIAASIALMLQQAPQRASNLHKPHLPSQAEPQDSQLGWFTATLDGTLLTADQTLAKLLGFSNVAELKHEAFQHGLDRFYYQLRDKETVAAELRAHGVVHQHKLQARRKTGEPFWAQLNLQSINAGDDVEPYLQGSIADITQTELELQRRLQAARFDKLTGLLNHQAFLEELTTAAKNGTGSVIFIDLDNFKALVSRFGQQAADNLLVQLGQLLKDECEQPSPIARLDNDRFVMLLANLNANQGFVLAFRLLEVIRQRKFTLKEHVLSLTASLGILHFEAGEHNAALLLHRAKLASRIAKDKGRNRIHTFSASDEEHEQQASDSVRLNAVVEALDKDLFSLMAQPIRSHSKEMSYRLSFKLALANNASLEHDALLDIGLRHHLAERIDQRLVERYLNWLSQNPLHNEQLSLAMLPISQATFNHQQALEQLLTIIDRQDISHQKVGFVLSESICFSQQSAVNRFRDTVTQLGYQFAIADFGTTFSSLAGLKSLQPKVVELDTRALRTSHKDELTHIMLQAAITAAHAKHAVAVASHVESVHQLQQLHELGFDAVWGNAIAIAEPINNLHVLHFNRHL